MLARYNISRLDAAGHAMYVFGYFLEIKCASYLRYDTGVSIEWGMMSVVVCLLSDNSVIFLFFTHPYYFILDITIG